MKKTRILFSLLMAVVMMAMSPQTLWALGGSGTSSSPYTIANASDLVAFANKVNGSEQGAYAKLTADITLTSAWTAMGTSSKPYTGTFDGQGHKISGLNLTAIAANAGLFGYVNGATIKNFSLAGSISSNSDNLGSVVGHSKGNTQILDVVSSVNITMSANKSHLGGIVGYLCDGSGDTPVLKGCTYSGTMNVAGSTDSNGGIVGFGYKNANISITNCFFSGSIKTTGSNARVGGILGYADDDGSNFVALSNCFVSGSFSTGSGTGDVGAIAGCPRGNVVGKITNNTFINANGVPANALGNSKTSATSTPITISVTANANGSVSQSYVNPTTSAATQLQVVATPNAHYHFSSWSDSGAQTHNVGLTTNVSLTASFAIDTHTITVATNSSTMGTVNTSGGTYDYNTKLTITATPKTGYHFVEWNDANKNASRTITVTEDKTYTATFAAHTYGNAVWTWATDGKSASAKITCTTCGNVLSGNATITSKVKTAATCTSKGTTTYTAKVTLNNKEYTATKDVVDVAAKGHDFTAQSTDDAYRKSAATCTADAVYYHKCSRCTEKGTTTWTKTGTALGHIVNENNQCTRTGCNHKAKAVYSDGTLTFYFDDADHSGTTYSLNTGDNTPEWDSQRSSITSVIFDPSFATARPTSCYEWFAGFSVLEAITGLGFLNTEEVTSMSSMFNNCTKLTKLDLSSFNTSKVTDMKAMFPYCSKLTSLNLSSFNTSQVTDMNQMFYHCDILTSLDLSSFNTSQVKNMKYMFWSCKGLKELTIGNFDMQMLTDMSYMFYDSQVLNTLTMKSLPYLAEGTFDVKFSGKTVNYELDDNSVIYAGTNNLPTPATSTATYTRRGIKNQWGTIVVPFELNGSGDDYDLYTLSKASSEELTLTKVNGTITAGTPAIIRLKDGLAGNYNLTITAADPAVTTQMEEGSEADGLQLVGAYEATQLTDNDYFIANNKFWRAGDMSAPVKAAPFRAYLKNTTGSAKASALNIAVEDDSATALDVLNVLNDTDAQYYDLNGHRIPQLQKGINIVKYGNGKTVKVNIK